jgi:hypothetical protein
MNENLQKFSKIEMIGWKNLTPDRQDPRNNIDAL